MKAHYLAPFRWQSGRALRQFEAVSGLWSERDIVISDAELIDNRGSCTQETLQVT